MKLSKAGRLLANPRHWRALRHGVAPTVEHAGVLRSINPRTVIDVGANKGQFSLCARELWPEAAIVGFEPNPVEAAIYQKLLKDRARLIECALAAEEREMDLHLASRADSSSLLPLGDRQKQLFDMEEVDKIKVPVRRLDCVLDRDELESPALLKIDVQGFEYEVLEGMAGIVEAIGWVYVETSQIELYKGQKLHGAVAGLLCDMGFRRIAEANVVHDARGRKIQSDSLFVGN